MTKYVLSALNWTSAFLEPRRRYLDAYFHDRPRPSLMRYTNTYRLFWNSSSFIQDAYVLMINAPLSDSYPATEIYKIGHPSGRPLYPHPSVIFRNSDRRACTHSSSFGPRFSSPLPLMQQVELPSELCISSPIQLGWRTSLCAPMAIYSSLS